MKGSWSPDCQRLSATTRICFEDWRARRAFKRTRPQLRLFLASDRKRLRSPLTSLARHNSRPSCVVVDELVLVLGIWSWIIGRVDQVLFVRTPSRLRMMIWKSMLRRKFLNDPEKVSPNGNDILDI